MYLLSIFFTKELTLYNEDMIVYLIKVWKTGESQTINWATISYHLQKSTHNEEKSLMLNLSYKTRIKHSK